MKKFLLSTLFLFLVSFSVEAAPKKTPTTRPSNSKAGKKGNPSNLHLTFLRSAKVLDGTGIRKGWKLFLKPFVLTRKNAKTIITQMQSPAATTLHFLASMLRGDMHYLASLSPRMKPQLREKVERRLQKTFKPFQKLKVRAYTTRQLIVALKKKNKMIQSLVQGGFRNFGPFQAIVMVTGPKSGQTYLYLDQENGFWRVKGLVARYATFLMQPRQQKRRRRR